MANQTFNEEVKMLIDKYENGAMEKEALRKLKNMLYVLGDDVKSQLEKQTKI